MCYINKISDEDIQRNKDEFIKLIRSITREGADLDRLLNKLETSDFFTAPASTIYHNSCYGGLCEHSLNVYKNLKTLWDTKVPVLGITDENVLAFYKDSLKIVGLLHDISKMNIYEASVRNKKVYCDDGKQYDDLGKYKWVSEKSFAKKDVNECFIYGNHEINSEFMLRQFIPLTVEESTAILHHMGSMSFDSAKDNIGVVYNKYPLALLLYMADMMSTYIEEREAV